MRFVLAAVAGLGVAIWFALALGELYDLEAAGDITPGHLGLARGSPRRLSLAADRWAPGSPGADPGRRASDIGPG